MAADLRHGENTTDEMRIYDRFYVSLSGPASVIFSLFCLEKSEKAKTRRDDKV
jgi:hypothetical protein